MSSFEQPARPARRAAAWPGLLVGFLVPLGLVAALFWFRASLPDTNFGVSQDDSLFRYWIKVIVLCAVVGAVLWAALWYGWLARSGRDVGFTLLILVFAATFAGAGGAILVKQHVYAPPRLVAEMEAQWAHTQHRDVGRLISEVNGARIGDAFEPEAMAKDPLEATYRTARARKAVQKHRRWREQRIETYRARIQALPADAATRQRVLSAFERQRRQTERSMMAFHDGVEDSLLEVEALAKFMDRSRGRWRVQGGRIVFGSESDFNHVSRGLRHYDDAFNSQAAAHWDLRGNPLLARDQELFPGFKPAPRHKFVLF